MAYYCYMLKCKNGNYYTGWSKDPFRRLKQHNAGRGARYTRMNAPCELVYAEEVPDLSAALKLESKIKTLKPAQKKSLISNPERNQLPKITALSKARSKKPKHFTVLSPGRVNLLGEHIDYNDGIVLPMAIDRKVTLQVKTLKEPVLRLNALDMDEKVELSLEDLDSKTDLNQQPLPPFALYPAGVAWALKAAGLPVSGLEVSYSSDIPMGAGLSSSAAVELGFALAWQIGAGWEIERMEMALLCKQAENDYVGLKSGLMDQFSVAHGVAGHALALDTRSLDWQTLRLPPDTSVVIADSAQRRKLTESGYNKRKQECSDALQILRSWCSDLASWRDVDPSFLEAHLAELPTDIGKRAQHVVGEIQRVQLGCKCLEAGDAQGFGELMFASHSSLKELYEVSSFELDSLVQIAAGLPGCLGARLTGAGFGGCTVNLVQKEFAPEFIEQLLNQYTKKTGLKASVFECFASDGVRLLND